MARASATVELSCPQGLEKRGHNVTAFPWGAVVQLITVDPDSGNFTAISDPRKDGAPAAY